jgi:hypothetical protein
VGQCQGGTVRRQDGMHGRGPKGGAAPRRRCAHRMARCGTPAGSRPARTRPAAHPPGSPTAAPRCCPPARPALVSPATSPTGPVTGDWLPAGRSAGSFMTEPTALSTLVAPHSNVTDSFRTTKIATFSLVKIRFAFACVTSVYIASRPGD